MPPVANHQSLRHGAQISAIGAVWTVAASTTGIVLGVGSSSLALIAFGAVGLLDAAGSVTLVIHFMLAHSGSSAAERIERLALLVITGGLVTVGCCTVVVSALELARHHGADSTPGSVVLTAVSLVVLTVLSVVKRRIARRIPSHPLLADSHLSAIGAVLAAVTLMGIAATSSIGWWWADSVAAIAIAAVAVWLGLDLRKEEVQLEAEAEAHSDR